MIVQSKLLELKAASSPRPAGRLAFGVKPLRMQLPSSCGEGMWSVPGGELQPGSLGTATISCQPCE